jgi:hypothetical protein
MESAKHAHEAVAAAFGDITSQTDRAAAILATSIVDHFLGIALARRFLDMPKTVRGRLFGSRGSLQSFSTKADVACAVGLCSSDGRHALDIIGRIRNRFAHYPVTLSFTDASIENLTAHLPIAITDNQQQRSKSSVSRLKFEFTTMIQATYFHGITELDIKIKPIMESHPDLIGFLTNRVFGAFGSPPKIL